MAINYDSMNGGQIEAVKHGVGPSVVAAPAGSGKTHCFVNRIARLLFEEGVFPSQVLGLTFTREAAGNMKERLKSLIPNEWHEDLQISTIHSMCWGILRDANPSLKTAMAADKFLIPSFAVKSILEQFCSNFRSIYDLKDVKLSYFTSAFGLAKNYHVTPMGSSKFFASKGFGSPDMLEEAYRFYERERLSYVDRKSPSFQGRYDQDDVLVMTAEILKNDANLRRRWGSKFKFILVDEVQDTSPIQFEIVEALMEGGGHTNLMLVGDLRQSIYGFRGAFPQYIQDFTDKFNARVINLQFNYRSVPPIVKAANKVARAMLDIDERFRADMLVGRKD